MEASVLIEMLEKNTDMRFVEKVGDKVCYLKDGEEIPFDHIAPVDRQRANGLYKISEATCEGGENGDCRVGAPSPTCDAISQTKCGVWYLMPFEDQLIRVSDLGLED